MKALDTNVLVSALLSPTGAPAQVLDLVRTGQVQIVVDERIVAEYAEVLRRGELFGQSTDALQLISDLAAEAEWIVAAPCGRNLPDSDDQMFLEAAAAAGADCIVTGNKRHFPAGVCRPVGVGGPSQLIKAYRGG